MKNYSNNLFSILRILSILENSKDTISIQEIDIIATKQEKKMFFHNNTDPNDVMVYLKDIGLITNETSTLKYKILDKGKEILKKLN